MFCSKEFVYFLDDSDSEKMMLFCFQERLLTLTFDKRVIAAMFCVLVLITYQIRVANRNVQSQLKTLKILCYGDSLTAGAYGDKQLWPYSISLKETLEISGYSIFHSSE